MKNISYNKASVKLNPGATYFVIDALYYNDIKEELPNIDICDFEREVKKKVFPYCDTPYAVYKVEDSLFEIEKIKNARKHPLNIANTFSTDTGLILFIERSLFFDLIKDFEYDKLVDPPNGPIDETYWEGLVSKYNKNDLALVLAPGIDSRYDFGGSGQYVIV